MNSDQLEQYLKQKMITNTFALARVLENGIRKITDGYIGYQITAGLWLKLRIYTCHYKNDELLFEEVLNEAFWSLNQAKNRVDQALNLYK